MYPKLHLDLITFTKEPHKGQLAVLVEVGDDCYSMWCLDDGDEEGFILAKWMGGEWWKPGQEGWEWQHNNPWKIIEVTGYETQLDALASRIIGRTGLRGGWCIGQGAPSVMEPKCQAAREHNARLKAEGKIVNDDIYYYDTTDHDLPRDDDVPCDDGDSFDTSYVENDEFRG